MILVKLRYIFILFFCIALSSCSKFNVGSNELPYISFGVSSVGVDTKGLITGFNDQSIFIYGVKNNTENIYNGDVITRETGDNWLPANKKHWEAGSSYSFYGYTKSGNCIISNSGMKIDVTQPATYSPSDMVDYMLSHAYKVADGSNYHTVQLKMQHAMACVDIVVKKEDILHQVTLQSITLNNIFSSATMQCESQAIVNGEGGNSGNNVWITNLKGDNDQSYSLGEFTINGLILGTMSILAVPQQLYSETTLTVNYQVTEYGGSVKNYTQTFQLFKYDPYVWESGHKIVYTLTINTGVQLKADIVDWKEAGYTEGIFLPPTTP